MNGRIALTFLAGFIGTWVCIIWYWCSTPFHEVPLAIKFLSGSLLLREFAELEAFILQIKGEGPDD